MNTIKILMLLVIMLSLPGIAMAVQPAVTDVTNETGTIWAQWDWTAGSGNVTDSYNISLTACGSDTVHWVNGSTNDYKKFTTTTTPKVCAGSATATIYAFNTTFSELSSGVSNTVTVPLMFAMIVNLIDAIVPLFTSILDLIIAVFPLVIAMAFLAGLALLINKIFDKVMRFK